MPAIDVPADTIVHSTGTIIDTITGGTALLQLQSGEIVVSVPGGTFAGAVTLTLSTTAVPSSSQSTIKVTNVGMEIHSGGLQPGREISITVQYRDEDIAGLEESKLALARYENGHWIPIPTTVYPSQNKLVGSIRHLSTFAVVQLAPAADLEGVIAFPNPYKPNQGTLTIANLTNEADILVFTIAGELVRSMSYTSADGRTYWDGKNDSGPPVASGVYLVLVKSSDGKKILKVALLR